MTYLTSNRYWVLCPGHGAAAAVVVAVLLAVLIKTVEEASKSVEGLLEVAGQVASNTAGASRSSRRRRRC